MKLDRNVNANGKGKYALVRLRGIETGTVAYGMLQQLYKLGHVDFGIVGEKDEFFVIKLRDRFAADAIRAYSDAVMTEAAKCADNELRANDLAQYALQVQSLERRAGILSEFCKDPD